MYVGYILTMKLGILDKEKKYPDICLTDSLMYIQYNVAYMWLKSNVIPPYVYNHVDFEVFPVPADVLFKGWGSKNQLTN